MEDMSNEYFLLIKDFGILGLCVIMFIFITKMWKERRDNNPDEIIKVLLENTKALQSLKDCIHQNTKAIERLEAAVWKSIERRPN